MLSPTERSLRAKIGAYALHSQYDPRETTRKAREEFLGRFEREVDPDGVLPVAERRRRAEAARHRYFAALAFRSARTRSRRKANKKAADGKSAAGEVRRDGVEPSL